MDRTDLDALLSVVGEDGLIMVGIHLLMEETLEIPVQSLGQEDALEKGMATHSSVLAWRVPGTGEPGGLPSMGRCLGQEDPLKGMATHSSILA